MKTILFIAMCLLCWALAESSDNPVDLFGSTKETYVPWDTISLHDTIKTLPSKPSNKMEYHGNWVDIQ